MSALQPASPWRRLGAFAIDYAVIAVYLAIVSAAFAALPRSFVVRLFATPLSGQLIVVATLTAPVLLYFALMEGSRWRATAGKRALGVAVATTAGGRVTLRRALGRNALKLLPWELAHTCLWRVEGWPTPNGPPEGWPLAGIVAVWVIVIAYGASMLLSARRRTLYDLAAGTEVVRRATSAEST